MSFTVVPIHNLSLEPGIQIPFGDGFVLQDVPAWLKKDKHTIDDLNRHDRQSLFDARHAFVAEYAAEGIGEPDPNWTGKEPKSIQEVKFQSVILANFAIWLRQPSPVCFTNGFHAIMYPNPEGPDKLPIIQQTQNQIPLYCHPNDTGNPVYEHHVNKAGELHQVLAKVPRNNPVWEALRATWAALTMYSADRRYPFFWMALESLFGSDDANEIGYKLAQRISFFLADNPEDARNLFRKVKRCYKTRSTIIHGRWKNDPHLDEVMADSEAIVRTAFRRLLEEPGMLGVFISGKRNEFLEDWVFSRSTDAPPFPTTL